MIELTKCVCVCKRFIASTVNQTYNPNCPSFKQENLQNNSGFQIFVEDDFLRMRF